MQSRYVMAALSACLIMSAMVVGSVCFGYFMEPVTSEMGFERGPFSLYFTIVTVVGGLSLPVYGRLIPRIGIRKIVIVCGLWTAVFMAAFSLANSLPMFYLFGFLVGLGFFGCSYAVVPVIVSNWFETKDGLVIGLASATGGAIAIVLGLIYPNFIAGMGWRAGYVLLGILIFVLTVLPGIFLLRDKPQSLGLEPYGHDQAKAAAKDAPSEAALASGMTFAEALKSGAFWLVIIALTLIAMTASVTQHLAAFFVSVGFDVAMAGVFVSVISAGLVVTNILVGAVADRLGIVRTLVIAGILYTVSFILLPLTVAIPIICVSLVLMSLGNGYVAVLAPVITQNLVGMREFAAIWGVVSMVCVLGQGLGAPIWGVVYDVTGSYGPAMYGAAVVVAIASLGLVAAARKRTEG